jgi:hypothetical protein
MFDFSKAQEITDQIIKLQNELKFKEAAILYNQTVKKIDSSKYRLANQTEWISNLLADQTREILLLLD